MNMTSTDLIVTLRALVGERHVLTLAAGDDLTDRKSVV